MRLVLLPSRPLSLVLATGRLLPLASPVLLAVTGMVTSGLVPLALVPPLLLPLVNGPRMARSSGRNFAQITRIPRSTVLKL